MLFHHFCSICMPCRIFPLILCNNIHFFLFFYNLDNLDLVSRCFAVLSTLLLFTGGSLHFFIFFSNCGQCLSNFANSLDFWAVLRFSYYFDVISRLVLQLYKDFCSDLTLLCGKFATFSGLLRNSSKFVPCLKKFVVLLSFSVFI